MSDTETTRFSFENVKKLFSPLTEEKLVGVDISSTHVRVYQFAEDGKNKCTEVEIGKSNSEEELTPEEKAKKALTTALKDADIKGTKVALSVDIGINRYHEDNDIDYSTISESQISSMFANKSLTKKIFKLIKDFTVFTIDWKQAKKGIYAIAYNAKDIKKYEDILKACDLDLELVAINDRKYAIFKGANSMGSDLIFDPDKTEIDYEIDANEYEKLTADESTKKDNKYLAANNKYLAANNKYLAAIGMANERGFIPLYDYFKTNYDLLGDRTEITDKEKLQRHINIGAGFLVVGFIVYILSSGFSLYNATKKLDAQIDTYEQLVSEKSSKQAKLTQVNTEIEKISGVLNAGANLDSNQQFMYLVLHSINKAVPRGVSLTNIDYSTKNTVVVSGLSVNDRNILQLIEELSKSESIDKSSLLSMSSKTVDKRMYKSFSIRCVISDQQVTNETEGL
jgi:Tfp pilus assembly protein PilN